ncbi:copper resistance protein CopC, partial [Klebsiella pneumoniae]
MSILNKAILTGGLVMGVAFSAMAHPELKSSVPQADSAVAAPEKIQLNFSENLTVKFSGAKLTMTGMKGMSSHSPMPVAAKVAPGADPKSMVIIPREPGNDSNLLIVFYVQIMPDDFVMQLHR